MRVDELGHECPETLWEYREMCAELGAAIGLPRNKAVAFLDRKIQEEGPQARVLAPESQMRMMLMRLITEDDDES